MTTQRMAQDAEAPALPRCPFPRTGAVALAGTAIGLTTQDLPGAEGFKAGEAPNMDPGLVGPQFFDKQEEQALPEIHPADQ